MFPLGRGGKKKGCGENEFPPRPRFVHCGFRENKMKKKKRLALRLSQQARCLTVTRYVDPSFFHTSSIQQEDVLQIPVPFHKLYSVV